MRNRVFICFLISWLVGGCSGPYVMQEVSVQDGMVVGTEQVSVDGNGQITSVTQEGDVPDSGYLDTLRNGGVDPAGPNAPGGAIPVVTP